MDDETYGTTRDGDRERGSSCDADVIRSNAAEIEDNLRAMRADLAALCGTPTSKLAAMHAAATNSAEARRRRAVIAAALALSAETDMRAVRHFAATFVLVGLALVSTSAVHSPLPLIIATAVLALVVEVLYAPRRATLFAARALAYPFPQP